MVTKQDRYTVEYVFPFNNVVFYRDITANGIEDAKVQIQAAHPDVIIRAVTLQEEGTTV
ncbi:hypothetical protein KZ483_27075 [Paenibacillus sp. sptzw28]|uniref:hypothetical protein n=1 Tax=Paenibacillus sp. sptzw28 TaxID=715179 RepID=UPI001C6DDF55|nr:hypothetical protein [Paenibacillus sp. sptzw28]QYR21301.1 hypothetical protein KZ483_27075 [Paenibacillus sp. sptzw28]